jgi:hypothetical protein
MVIFFLTMSSVGGATNPISFEVYNQEISSAESGNKLVKWWNVAKAKIETLSKWTLITGVLAGPVLILAILADIAAIGYLGIGLMILSLILGIFVLTNKDKSAADYNKSKFRVKLGMLFALLPIAIGILFVLTFSL